MLVLSRLKGESIVINNQILVTVIDIKGERVRLGVECPRDIPVDRQEIQEEINRGAKDCKAPLS